MWNNIDFVTDKNQLSSILGNGGAAILPDTIYGVMYTERTGASAATVSDVDDPVGTYHDLITDTYFIAPSDATRPVFRSDGLVSWLESDGTQYLVGSITEVNARKSTLMVGAVFDTIFAGFSQVALAVGSSGSLTPYIAIGERNDLWASALRSDSSASTVLENGSANSKNGYLLETLSDEGQVVSGENYAYSTGVTASDAITIDQVGVLCLPRSTIGDISEGRLYAGFFVPETLENKDADVLRNVIKRQLGHYYDRNELSAYGTPALTFNSTQPNQWYLDALATYTQANLVTNPVTSDDVGGVYGVNRFSVENITYNGATNKYLRFVVNEDDPDTSGVNKKRNEISFSVDEGQLLEYGTRHVFAYSFARGESWAGTDSPESRDETIVIQIHAGEGVPQSPYFEMTLRNNGFIVMTRSDPNGYSSPTVIDQYEGDLETLRPYLLQGEITPQKTGNGVFKLYLDGKIIVNYTGAIGYNIEQEGNFKIGHYHPLDQGKVWDESVPTRSIFSGGFSLVRSDTLNPKNLKP